MPTTPPRLVCLPSWDGEFRAHVEAVIAGNRDVASPSELEAALRAEYSAAIVRASELSGLRTPTWYVYRDGHFPWVDPASDRHADAP